MSIDQEVVKKIAKLAHLSVNDEHCESHVQALNSVLGIVDQLQSYQTEGVEPMAHPTHAMQRLREDTVSESNQREKFQNIAPQVEQGLYIVPQVIE